MDFCPYIWNTEEVRVISLRGSDMASTTCHSLVERKKCLKICNVKSFLLAPGLELCIFMKEAVEWKISHPHTKPR